MQPAKYFLAVMLPTAISAASATAQDASHHPAAAAAATPAVAPPAIKPGQGVGMMQSGPSASDGPDMAMMRECMGMMASMMQGMGPADMMAGTAPDDPVDGAFAAINRRMHRDMAVPTGGNPDAAFAQAMIAHHQGAIDMARVILGFGTDPAIHKLAQDVIAAQEGEIRFLRQWLADRPKP